MAQQTPRRSIKYDDVPTFAISGFFGGVNPNEGSISFFKDTLVPQIGGSQGQIVLDTVEHEFIANIRMSPLVFKRLAIWMSEHVKRYESMHGEIQVGTGKPKEDSVPPSYYG
jgi:hypothetical protein